MKPSGLTLHALSFVVVAVASTFARAQSYDAGADWSDAANPNGVWSYRSGGALLSSVTRASDPWTNPQASWGDLPGWFKSNGTEQFPHDWIAGDIVTHTGSSELRWTSPAAGIVDIAGSVWATRDIGRFSDWTVLINGSQVTGGTVGSGDPFSRANPFLFSAGSGGASVLSNVLIGAGDTIELRIVSSPGSTGDYAGATMSVAYIPEPASIILIGFVCLAVRRQRRS